MNGSVPTTKTARHALIIEALTHHTVHSQGELARLLESEGLHVSQGTLSRDLVELDAVRVRGAEGALVYAVPGEGGDRRPQPGAGQAGAGQRLARLAGDLLVSADSSANMVVLRTPPGAAQFLASALDHVDLTTVLGCVAGDDTVLVISRQADGGSALRDEILALVNSSTDTTSADANSARK